jgi:hypothetical protein
MDRRKLSSGTFRLCCFAFSTTCVPPKPRGEPVAVLLSGAYVNSFISGGENVSFVSALSGCKARVNLLDLDCSRTILFDVTQVHFLLVFCLCATACPHVNSLLLWRGAPSDPSSKQATHSKNCLIRSLGSRSQWRAVSGMKRLLPLKHWQRGFESHSRHGCLCAFILCLCCPVCR